MPDAPYPDLIHRWNWFRRRRWWPDYRDRMLRARGGSCGIVLEAMGGAAGGLVLDAACGLGRKTLILHHLGADVMGSDAGGYAVRRARDLAAEEGRAVDFFVSAWRELPDRAPGRFDAVLVDAFIDACETREDLEASFRGVAGVLRPGGVLTCFGPGPQETNAQIIEQAWRACDRFYLDWSHAQADRACTCLRARERGADFIDDHHLYLVTQGEGAPRLEHATVRQWFRWERACLEEVARSAGFSSFETCVFGGYGFGGAPIERIIARR